MTYEIIGILATIFILAGFMYSEERMIRRFNLVGALLYVIYGLLINSPSNIILNFAILAIHLYKLRKKEGDGHC